jgi:hypothetical protein
MLTFCPPWKTATTGHRKSPSTQKLRFAHVQGIENRNTRFLRVMRYFLSASVARPLGGAPGAPPAPLLLAENRKMPKRCEFGNFLSASVAPRPGGAPEPGDLPLFVVAAVSLDIGLHAVVTVADHVHFACDHLAAATEGGASEAPPQLLEARLRCRRRQ